MTAWFGREAPPWQGPITALSLMGGSPLRSRKASKIKSVASVHSFEVFLGTKFHRRLYSIIGIGMVFWEHMLWDDSWSMNFWLSFFRLALGICGYVYIACRASCGLNALYSPEPYPLIMAYVHTYTIHCYECWVCNQYKPVKLCYPPRGPDGGP